MTPNVTAQTTATHAPVARTTHAQLQQGIALLEVLLVATLLGIALLGLASMQTSSLRFNKSAYNHTQAAILAQDILEKMRSNSQGTTEGFYDGAHTEANALPTAPTCPNNQCDAKAMAQRDIRDWASALQNTLPGSEGLIKLDKKFCRYTVAVRWQEPGAQPRADACLATDTTLEDTACFHVIAQL